MASTYFEFCCNNLVDSNDQDRGLSADSDIPLYEAFQSLGWLFLKERKEDAYSFEAFVLLLEIS